MKGSDVQMLLLTVICVTVFIGVLAMVINRQTEDAKVQAIKAGATPAQLTCAFHPPKTAYSRNKICSKDMK